MKLTAGAAVAAAASRALAFTPAQTGSAAAGKYAAIDKPLDAFIAGYMKEMNSPGLTLGLADRNGPVRAAAFGFGDVESKSPVRPEQMFQIGSISKSFCAITLLQLREEGKLDLNKPVKEYLPWLPLDSSFAPITTHHLLTHSSGLQSGIDFPICDPAARIRPGYAPGEHFHYSNFAFHMLGFLVSTLDERPFPESLQKRIFDRLGMTQSDTRIRSSNRERQVTSYVPLHDDRPYPRYGALVQSPWIVSDDAAGCICSTGSDMAKYVTMLCNRGKLQNGRLLSEESFALFSKPYIPAEEFGPGAHYGYGIAVDQVDGNTILRHTGGMISFMSAMHVNIDEGVGAFASVNAQQGYRPNPVAAYAIKLMRAANHSQPLPAPPEGSPQLQVKNSADYAGRYTAPGGKTLEFTASGDSLFLVHNSQRVPLQAGGGDSFLALHPDFALFPLVFGREKAEKSALPASISGAASTPPPSTPVIDVVYGPEWYASEKNAQHEAVPTAPKEWEQYVGHYHSDNPWEGSFRVIERRGTLYLDGVVELKPLGPDQPGSFHVMDEDPSPEWIRFESAINGKMQLAMFSHVPFRRVAVE